MGVSLGVSLHRFTTRILNATHGAGSVREQPSKQVLTYRCSAHGWASASAKVVSGNSLGCMRPPNLSIPVAVAICLLVPASGQSISCPKAQPETL
jgi:hypothetical protein